MWPSSQWKWKWWGQIRLVLSEISEMFPMFKELSGLCELNYLGKSLWQITASGSESKYSKLSLSCWWMGDVALETNETPADSSLSMVSKLSLNEKNVKQWLVQWCLLEDLPGKVARVWNKKFRSKLDHFFLFLSAVWKLSLRCWRRRACCEAGLPWGPTPRGSGPCTANTTSSTVQPSSAASNSFHGDMITPLKIF